MENKIVASTVIVQSRKFKVVYKLADVGNKKTWDGVEYKYYGYCDVVTPRGKVMARLDKADDFKSYVDMLIFRYQTFSGFKMFHNVTYFPEIKGLKSYISNHFKDQDTIYYNIKENRVYTEEEVNKLDYSAGYIMWVPFKFNGDYSEVSKTDAIKSVIFDNLPYHLGPTTEYKNE